MRRLRFRNTAERVPFGMEWRRNCRQNGFRLTLKYEEILFIF